MVGECSCDIGFEIFDYGFISQFVNVQPAKTSTLCIVPRSQTNPKLGTDETVISSAACTTYQSGDKSIFMVTLTDCQTEGVNMTEHFNQSILINYVIMECEV